MSSDEDNKIKAMHLENDGIFESLWERVTDTDFPVFSDDETEQSQEVALGDIEGLQNYTTNSYEGICAIINAPEMADFSYEARYEMAHYLLERFFARLGEGNLDSARMKELEAINLIANIDTPSIQTFRKTIRTLGAHLFEPPIANESGEALQGMIVSRALAALNTFQILAQEGQVMNVSPISDPYLQVLLKIIREVATSAASENKHLNPNDVLRCVWHVIDDGFSAQENEVSPEEFYKHFNLKSEYFQSLLEECRINSAQGIALEAEKAGMHSYAANTPQTHSGYKPRLAEALSTEERVKIINESSAKANAADALVTGLVEQARAPKLPPTLAEFRNRLMHSTIATKHQSGHPISVHLPTVLGKHFDGLFVQMQHALEGQNIDLEKSAGYTPMMQSLLMNFLGTRMRTYYEALNSAEAAQAFEKSVSRAMLGSPSQFEQLIALGCQISAPAFSESRFYYTPAGGGIESREAYEYITSNPSAMAKVNQQYGELSNESSRFARVDQIMQAINKGAQLLKKQASTSNNEFDAKCNQLEMLSYELKNPPKAFEKMPASAAAEIMLTALFDVLNPDITSKEFAAFYNSDDVSFFVSRMNAHPTNATIMQHYNGRITPDNSLSAYIN